MVAYMLDPKLFDDIAQRLTGAMPSAAREIQTDLEKNLRAATQSVFAKLDKSSGALAGQTGATGETGGRAGSPAVR